MAFVAHRLDEDAPGWWQPRPVAAWAGDMAGGAGLAKRLGTFLSGLLECGAFCGIIFGWASLVFVLKDLRYFEGLCQPSATPSPNLTLGSGMDPHLSPPDS